jgi:hypothetical protein
MSDMRAALCRLREIYEHYKRILSKNKQGAFKFFFRDSLTWDDVFYWHELILIQNPTLTSLRCAPGCSPALQQPARFSRSTIAARKLS